MTDLARSLGTRDHTSIQSQKDCYLPEEENGNQIITFQVPMIDASNAEHTTHFKELYWNDLSFVKNSWLGIAKGIFNVVTGLRHLVTPTEKDQPTKPLAKLAQIFFSLLGGPILGGSALVFLIWALLILIHVCIQVYCKDDNVEWLVINNLHWLFPLVSTFIGLFILLVPIKLNGLKMRRLWTMKCLAVLAIAAAIAYPIIRYLCPHLLTNVGNSILWVVVVPVVGFWALANLNMILIFGGTLVQGIRFKFKTYPSMIIPALSTMLTMTFLIAAIPVLIVGSDTAIPDSLQFTGMEQVIDRSLPTVGWIWLGFVIVAITAGLFYTYRISWFRRNKAKISPDNAPPRLVFSMFLFWVFLILSIPAIFTFFVNLAGQLNLLDKTNNLNALTQSLRLIVIVTIPVLLPLLAMAKSGIRLTLDLTLDIVNYFKPNPEQAFSAWRTNYDAIDFKFRKRVLERLDKILELALEGEGEKELVLLTHSQGTIFGLDYVSDNKNKSRLLGFSKVVLITMGSPFKHVYQHYFPKMFNQEQRYHNIKEILGNNPWINIYCNDDYIGTYISPFKPNEDQSFASPINIELDKGGHTQYFTDRRVMDLLGDLEQELSLKQKK